MTMEHEEFDFLSEPGDNSFEMQMIENLLVEELAAKRAEVFENVVFERKKRYYIEDLSKRDYCLESTTPYQIKLGATVIEDHAWGNMLVSVVKHLLTQTLKANEALLDFSVSWTKQKMFSLDLKTNHKQVSDTLYMNCNHTALHSCWLLQDLLDYFEVDKSEVYFLIHRPCGAEPQNVKEYIEKRFKGGFVEFLTTNKSLSEDAAQNVITYFDKILNKYLASITKSYNNFYLFDDNTILASYRKKVEIMISQSQYNEKSKKTLLKCLMLLSEYYRQ